MMAAKIRTMTNNIVRNEQDTHMFDTEDQEFKIKATKEEDLRSSTVSGYSSISTSYKDKYKYKYKYKDNDREKEKLEAQQRGWDKNIGRSLKNLF